MVWFFDMISPRSDAFPMASMAKPMTRSGTCAAIPARCWPTPWKTPWSTLAERPTLEKPPEVSSCARIVMSTVFAIWRSHPFDAHERHQLAVFLQERGQGVAAEPLQEPQERLGAG